MRSIRGTGMRWGSKRGIKQSSSIRVTAEVLESRKLLSVSSYPLTLVADHAPIWAGGVGFDKQVSIFNLNGGPWTYYGYGATKFSTSLSAHAYASTGTVNTNLGGLLKVTWPDVVRPGQQDVPVTISLGSLAGNMSGYLGAGIDVPLSASLSYKLPGVGSGTLGFTANLEDYLGKALGITVRDVALNTNASIAPTFGTGSTASGAANIVDAKFDVIQLGKYIPVPPVAAVFRVIDPFLDANLGMAVDLVRTDHFTPSSLKGNLLLNGSNAGQFSLTGGTQTVLVDIPPNVGSSISMDISGLSLPNSFYSSFGLNFDPYFQLMLKAKIKGIGVSVELYKKDFANVSMSLLSLPAKTLPFTITDPAPKTVAVEKPFSTIPTAGGFVQAENYNIGGEGIAYHDTTAANEGAVYRTDAVDLITTIDTGPGYQVNKITTGEYLDYFINVATAGYYDVDYRINSKSTDGKVSLEVNGAVAPDSGVAIPNTFTKWQTISSRAVKLPAGVVHLRVKFSAIGLAGVSTSLNWLKIYASAAGNTDGNDQLSEAFYAPVGSTVGGSISPSTDVDMYGFAVTAGKKVKFSATGIGLLLQKTSPLLRLFDSTGKQLSASASSISNLTYTFKDAGIYYVGVSGRGNGSYSPLTGLLDSSGTMLSSYSMSLAFA